MNITKGRIMVILKGSEGEGTQAVSRLVGYW